MKRFLTALAASLCALLLAAGPALAQYPPEPPDDTGVLPGDEEPADDGIGDVVAVDDDDETAVAGVSESQGSLAYSGFELVAGTLLAAVALALGGSLVVMSRRRRRAEVTSR